MLICLGGLPASGKTTIGTMLTDLYGEKASLIDPDLTRLQVLGRPLTDTIRDADLTPQTTKQTIATMLEKTRTALAAGRIVIVPSAFVGGAMRLSFEQMAKDTKVPFHGMWFDAPIETLHARALDRQNRRKMGIVDMTTISNVGPDRIKPTEIDGELTWLVIDTSRPRKEVFADVVKRLPRISFESSVGFELPQHRRGTQPA